MKRGAITDTPSADPYGVLGVDSQAALDEIKTAYFALVRAHPPERDPEGFKRIRAAYEQLRDPNRRLETDLLRLQPWPEPPLEDVLEDAPLDLSVDPADVIRAARALTDLDRHDFREDFREVNV
ncbi:MAG TPA: J domain-containing protein [Anaerolineae bacterium]